MAGLTNTLHDEAPPQRVSTTTQATELNIASVEMFLHRLIQADVNEDGHPVLAEILGDLEQAGLPAGTPVMLAMPNGRAFVTLVFALLLRGLVPVLLPSSAPLDRVKRMARVLGAKSILSGVGTFARRFAEKGRPIGTIAELRQFNEVQSSLFQPGEVILLTSGTSGIFSGCLFNIASLFRNGERHAASIGQTPGDRVLISLPMYYSFAFVGQLLTTFRLGGQAILSGPPFTPLHFTSTISSYGVTQASITPLMLEAWLRSEDKTLPACLRRLTIGGAQAKPANIEELIAHNPGLEVFLTYGLTEAGPRVSTLAAHLEPASRYASVGHPMPGITVRLNREKPEDQVGELIIETDTALIRTLGGRSTPIGAVKGNRTEINTGDLFSMDEDGYLYFHKRRASSISIHGEKVFVKSVCETTETIPGVSRAEAWVSTAQTGEVSLTLDVYVTDTSMTEADIRRQLAQVLLRSEQPTHLVIHHEQGGWRKT
ncbi:class I adenylate-forming enzyme family protein [Rhizobium helianthi]|uniref:Class I adenylate-forming enzyme family protein n=1 Tax=Rhizobium helianthi TaxID=1132695 RepID=A0ABW4M5P1_9HYPH